MGYDGMDSQKLLIDSIIRGVGIDRVESKKFLNVIEK